MIKKEIENKMKARHLEGLAMILSACEVDASKASQIFTRLRRIEEKARKCATDYINGVLDGSSFTRKIKHYEKMVSEIFNGKLQGFELYSDPRGSVLKIKYEFMKNHYADAHLRTDLAGNGLLAPRFSE